MSCVRNSTLQKHKTLVNHAADLLETLSEFLYCSADGPAERPENQTQTTVCKLLAGSVDEEYNQRHPGKLQVQLAWLSLMYSSSTLPANGFQPTVCKGGASHSSLPALLRCPTFAHLGVADVFFRSEFGPMTKSQLELVRCLEPQKNIRSGKIYGQWKVHWAMRKCRNEEWCVLYCPHLQSDHVACK